MNSHTGQDQEAHKPAQVYVGATARGRKVILCLAIPVHTSPAIYDQTQQSFIKANLGVRTQASKFWVFVTLSVPLSCKSYTEESGSTCKTCCPVDAHESIQIIVRPGTINYKLHWLLRWETFAWKYNLIASLRTSTMQTSKSDSRKVINLEHLPAFGKKHLLVLKGKLYFISVIFS